MMAIVSGVVCIAAGLARLGFITELLSKPIRYGYMNGIALTVMLSQIPKLFGFSVDSGRAAAPGAGRSSSSVLAGSTNVAALAIGASALALILVLKRWPRVPGHADRRGRPPRWSVGVFDLATRAGVSVLGPLPQGLPHAALAARRPSTTSCRS